MCRFALFSRVKHLREVGPLSRPVMWSMQMTQPVSAPLQSSLRFLPDCCPHRHWFILRCTFPRLRGSGMDLSCSTGMTRWVRSTLYAGSVCLPMTADERAAVLTARRAAQHFRLSVPHDAYECLCILIISTKPSPVSALCSQIHRRLAVLVPIFFAIVGTLSEGFERFVASPLQPRRLRATGCAV
jgi:hypothetical protein